MGDWDADGRSPGWWDEGWRRVCVCPFALIHFGCTLNRLCLAPEDMAFCAWRWLRRNCGWPTGVQRPGHGGGVARVGGGGRAAGGVSGTRADGTPARICFISRCCARQRGKRRRELAETAREAGLLRWWGLPVEVGGGYTIARGLAEGGLGAGPRRIGDTENFYERRGFASATTLAATRRWRARCGFPAGMCWECRTVSVSTGIECARNLWASSRERPLRWRGERAG